MSDRERRKVHDQEIGLQGQITLPSELCSFNSKEMMRASAQTALSRATVLGYCLASSWEGGGSCGALASGGTERDELSIEPIVYRRRASRTRTRDGLVCEGRALGSVAARSERNWCTTVP